MCGGGEIRTRDGREPIPLFESGAFNRSSHPSKISFLDVFQKNFFLKAAALRLSFFFQL